MQKTLPIRVCAITCDSYPADPLVRRTAEAAADAGYEYHVICSKKNNEKSHEIFHGVHVHRIPTGRISAKPLATAVLLWTAFTVLSAVKVMRLHFRSRFRVVHVHNLPDFLVFAALVPKLFGARIILHVQDVAPELMAAKAKGITRPIKIGLATWQERISVKFADHVLTVGWPFEEVLLKRGVRPEKLSSILNSADPKLFPMEKRSEPFLGEPTAERPLVLMYHGTCSERNGLGTAIRALAKARKLAPHLRLRIKGNGDSMLRLRELAKEMGVGDYVAFYGGGPVDEVVDFVAQGDVGVIPYQPNVFMDLVLPAKAYEFALMRRPMIASNTRAMRSMFSPGSVILCEPGNPDDFAEAIVNLYRNPRLRAEMIANAERDYAQYDWESMSKQYLRLLAHLATNGSSPGLTKHLADISN